MKKIILDLIIACALIALLAILAIANQTEAETFSPPSVGVGRTENQEVCKLQASCETLEIIEEIDIQPIETEISASETESESQEEIVEVIPVIEGKYLDVPMPTELQDFARQVSAEYGIPFELTMAVIYVESNFNSWAKSPTGDYGLMQVYYGVWNELGVDLENDTIQFDPRYNLQVGCGILKEKIELSGGDFTTALIRYNIGDSDAQKLFRQGIYSTEYSESVLAKYYAYLRGEY
jgi:soluble lytic murein transglycosylase-like protein